MMRVRKGHADAWPFVFSWLKLATTPRQTVGLLALCLLSSASWIVADVLPSAVAPVSGAGFRLVLVGLAGALLGAVKGRFWPFGMSARCGLVALASLGLVGVPLLLVSAAQGKMASTAGVLVFAGMPVLLAIVAGASPSAGSGLRSLPASLMGVAGLLIVLPLQLPHNGEAMLGLGAVVLAMACTAASVIWLHGLLQDFPFSTALVLAGFTNGIALSVVAALSAKPQWDLRALGVEGLRCLLFDLPETALMFWLVKAIAPQQLAVRYVLAPLFTIVEGLFLLKPHVDFRTTAGLALLGSGTYLMLRSERVDQDAGLHLT